MSGVLKLGTVRGEGEIKTIHVIIFENGNQLEGV